MKKNNILVFDGKTETLVAMLSNKDNDQCPFFDGEIHEQLNKDFTFEFSVPADHEDSKLLIEGNLVGIYDLDGDLQVFQIYKTEEIHNGDSLEKRVYSEHLFYELNDDIVEDQRVIDGTAATAMTKALSSSRWQVGTVDDLGLGTINFYYSSGLKNIQEVANTYGGELHFRFVLNGNQISQRLVDLRTRLGSDTGKRFEFTKDMVEVKRTVQMDGLKTAFYGRGKGEQTEDNGYTRKVTFRDVVWSTTYGDPVDKPAGQEWIGDPTALSKFGRANGTRHRFGVFEVDTTDPNELIEKTWQELQRVSTPVVTYEMSVISLEHFAGYEHEKVRKGDTVYVIDRELGLEIEARVLDIKRDPEDPEATEIVLGNFIDDITNYNSKIEQIEATITDRKGVWDSVENPIDDTDIVDVAPSVPAFVSAKGLFKSINVSWTFDPSIRVSSYELYGSKVQGFTPDPTNLLFKGKSGGHVIDADTNETWYFRVRAVNPHGVSSAYTQEFSATTTQVATPDFEDLSVTNEKVGNLSADKITFGTLDGTKATIVNIDANNINAGKLKAQYVQIGSTTTYENGYDPSTKETPSGSQAKANAAEQNAKDYTDQQLVNYVDVTTYGQDLENIQNQIDGNITTWFYDYDPTLTNAPANTWATNTDKDNHIGDLFYNTQTGYGWRFAKDSSTGAYSWVQIKDTDIQKALADAAQAQDTADSKRRVFVTQPIPPYDVGDLWTQGASGDIYKCKVARASGSYVASDWEKASKYTDDTRAIQAESNAKSYADTVSATAETNAKNYAKPSVVQVYDHGFVNGKSFWSDSYSGQEVTSTTKGTITPSTEALEGGNVWTLQGNAWLYSKNAIPVNVNRVYKVTFRVRQTVDKTIGGSNVYAGVATLDSNFQNITGGAGTHRYCAVAGTPIDFSMGWQTFEGLITGVGDTHDTFRAGTTFVRPMFIVNYSGGDGTVEVDFVKFEDVTEIQSLQETVNEVDLRTTESSIIATVRNSQSYQNDLDSKADASALGGYATNNALSQGISDANKYTDGKVKAVNDLIGVNPDNDGKTVFEKISAVDQKADEIDIKFTSSGGVNLLKNSVGFAGTDFWEVTLDIDQQTQLPIGTVETLQNAELSEKGVGSGFELKGAKLVQTIVNAPQYHTISTLVKKGTAGSGYIKVTYDNGTVEQRDFVSGTAYDYKKEEIIIEPVGNTITIEIYGTTDSGIIFTGTMVNVGNVALQWQHSAGEIYNTNVLMDLNGIRVNSSAYKGYTAITPEEFSGYAEVPDENNNPVMTKVFTLNKDVTEVSKIDIDKEVTMAPVKIVPVKSTNYTGWAFISEE